MVPWDVVVLAKRIGAVPRQGQRTSSRPLDQTKHYITTLPGWLALLPHIPAHRTSLRCVDGIPAQRALFRSRLLLRGLLSVIFRMHVPYQAGEAEDVAALGHTRSDGSAQTDGARGILRLRRSQYLQDIVPVQV